MTPIISGTRVWTYTMQGEVPPGIPDDQVDAWIKSGVSWCDTLLDYVRGRDVRVQVIDPTEWSRRLQEVKHGRVRGQ